MLKRYCILLSLCAMSLCSANAQSENSAVSSAAAFSRLDFSVTTGTTGVGVEFSTPLRKDVTLRAGFSYMPKFSADMDFSVEGRGANGEVTSFGSMAEKLQQVIGYEVNDEIEMTGTPSFYNFNILVDFHPFKNKNWHLTAGVYLGPNEVAGAVNKTKEMASLLAVGIYNNMLDRYLNDDPIMGDMLLDPEIGEMLVQKGRMGIYVGEFKKDVVLNGDDYKEGDPYMMEPDKNGMIKVRMKTNTFIRPYVGFGYGGRLVKGDDRCHVSFDCGAMYWGGVPKVLTHDGVDLARDLDNIRGQVDDYVKLVKNFPVCPVLNFKISYKLF